MIGMLPAKRLRHRFGALLTPNVLEELIWKTTEPETQTAPTRQILEKTRLEVHLESETRTNLECFVKNSTGSTYQGKQFGK